MAGLIFIGLLMGWFFTARWLAKLLTRSVKNEVLRRLSVAFIVILLLVLPVVDEIVGGFQFRALCKENAVLKIDAEKIKGKTIRVVINPSNKDVENTAVRIYFSSVAYQDTASGENLGSNSVYTAIGGFLIRSLAGGHDMTPLTFHSTCSGPGNLPTSEKYGFTLEKIN